MTEEQFTKLDSAEYKAEWKEHSDRLSERLETDGWRFAKQCRTLIGSRYHYFVHPTNKNYALMCSEALGWVLTRALKWDATGNDIVEARNQEG